MEDLGWIFLLIIHNVVDDSLVKKINDNVFIFKPGTLYIRRRSQLLRENAKSDVGRINTFHMRHE